jgi:hypothetical protein
MTILGLIKEVAAEGNGLSAAYTNSLLGILAEREQLLNKMCDAVECDEVYKVEKVANEWREMRTK